MIINSAKHRKKSVTAKETINGAAANVVYFSINSIKHTK